MQNLAQSIPFNVHIWSQEELEAEKLLGPLPTWPTDKKWQANFFCDLRRCKRLLEFFERPPDQNAWDWLVSCFPELKSATAKGVAKLFVGNISDWPNSNVAANICSVWVDNGSVNACKNCHQLKCPFSSPEAPKSARSSAQSCTASTASSCTAAKKRGRPPKKKALDEFDEEDLVPPPKRLAPPQDIDDFDDSSVCTNCTGLSLLDKSTYSIEDCIKVSNIGCGRPDLHVDSKKVFAVLKLCYTHLFNRLKDWHKVAQVFGTFNAPRSVLNPAGGPLPVVPYMASSGPTSLERRSFIHVRTFLA